MLPRHLERPRTFFRSQHLTVDHTPLFMIGGEPQNPTIMTHASKALKFSTTLVALISVAGAYAQNWKDLDAKTVKTLADTNLVRASEVIIQPHEKGSVHTHPAHFFYALSECKLIVHYTDGKEEKYDLKAGDNGYSNPERPHWTENVGDKPARFLIVELKEHPYAAPTGKR
jgi:quercetin dioxygenase-like cupin family protein